MPLWSEAVNLRVGNIPGGCWLERTSSLSVVDPVWIDTYAAGDYASGVLSFECIRRPTSCKYGCTPMLLSLDGSCASPLLTPAFLARCNCIQCTPVALETGWIMGRLEAGIVKTNGMVRVGC